MNKRYAASVGMRPAEGCGWLKYPASSRSASTFLTVADDRFRPHFRVSVRLLTGSPALTYSWITAYRIVPARDDNGLTVTHSGVRRSSRSMMEAYWPDAAHIDQPP